uniref:gamma-glutamylcyclotransferase n=1 Tax=Cacopsylla melanoneura TaxID=428564 RepID=A0A8D8ZGQ3_9HEMI
MKEDHFLYFAYGSNMSCTTLKKYCPTAEQICVAKLKDYRLDFQFWATIVPNPGKHVWGVVWQIHNRDIPQLDYYEDVVNNLYRVIQVTVETSNDSNMICRCYEMTSDFTLTQALLPEQNVNIKLKQDAIPATWYMKNIIDSAVGAKIPDYYIDELKAVPTKECAFRE